MFDVINPATGAKIRSLPQDSPAEIAAKARAARAARPAWTALGLQARLAILGKFRRLVAERGERLTNILTAEVGKPIAQSRNELEGLLRRLDFFLEAAPAALAHENVHSEAGLVEGISREPLGVVANISAWNYPLFVGSNVFVPALLAGNSVLYKPSEFASLTGLAVVGLLREAGVPQEVFVPVLGLGDAGAELLKQPLDGVFFTGSYATGLKVAEAASRGLVKMQLELGGKDPVYVRADVDVKTAAAGLADGAFYNTGQSCCSVERLYVHADIFEAFVEAFVAEVKAFRRGPVGDPATYWGAITRPAQLAVLEAQVADALAKGARLLCGGKRLPGPGNWFEGTVLVDVDHRMALMRDESFGPLIGIQKVKDDEQALELMNDTEYGLTAGVYTRDAAVAGALLARVNAGSVYFNCCDRVSPRLPWSGRGHSGLGSVLSKEGILTFTRPKAWHLRA
ncbi:MAG TPA: aldehyde dehydrogenase family protein [bacterium]|nr:aldehyde dehydrogenase family protein [bacterium]